MFDEIEESWVYGIELSTDFDTVIGDPVLLLHPPKSSLEGKFDWESRSVTAGEVNRRWTEGSFIFKELPDSSLELNIGDLVDFPTLLKQAHPGREELPYLQSRIDDAIKPVAENLYLLPSGPLPPNPSEILGSSRMDFLLGHLEKMFDVIIIDSPPILPASDALLISPHADGVLLVVKEGLLNREIVQKAVEQLHLAQANILGVVLNDVDVKKQGYSSYYHKYYSEYYGEKA